MVNKDMVLDLTKEQFESILNKWRADPEVKATKQKIRNYSWDKIIHYAYSRKYTYDEVVYPGFKRQPNEANKAKKPFPIAEVTELQSHITVPPYRTYKYWISFPELHYHYGGIRDAHHKKMETMMLRHMPKWLNVLYRKTMKGE
jgi:hypothetical protein